MKALVAVLLCVAVLLGIGLAVIITRQNAALKVELAALKAEQVQAEAQSNHIASLESALQEATNRPASATNETAAPVTKPSNELLRLRGQVGQLQIEKASIASSNALSKVTSDPQARKLLRDQQKLGMGVIYRGFSSEAKLTTEQKEKLNDMLADNIIDSVEVVTRALRDKPGPEEMNQMFAAKEKEIEESVREMLGDDGAARFREYTQNILGRLTGEQFAGMLGGDESQKEKGRKLGQLIQEESKAVLAEAGLPADYQTVPILNFRNIASEELGERSLKLMEDIYSRAAARSSDFLTPEELKKFEEFKALGINNSRAALIMNRTVMEPISK